MTLVHEPITLTVAEYLALERASDFKSEYINGARRPMTGASRKHNLIAGNIYASLHLQLRKSKCEIYPSDMRVYMPYANAYVYPDVTVVCDEPLLMEGVFDTLLNPQVIFEVLSPSTAQHDQTHKLNGYRGISSLNEYVLVQADMPHVVHYTRQEGGVWSVMDLIGLEITLTLSTFNVTLQLHHIYRRITFPPRP